MNYVSNKKYDEITMNKQKKNIKTDNFIKLKKIIKGKNQV